MSLQRGPNDPALIAGYSRAELVAEARRIAHNTRLMGGAYTAGLLEAIADILEAKHENMVKGQPVTAGRHSPGSAPGDGPGAAGIAGGFPGDRGLADAGAAAAAAGLGGIADAAQPAPDGARGGHRADRGRGDPLGLAAVSPDRAGGEAGGTG